MLSLSKKNLKYIIISGIMSAFFSLFSVSATANNSTMEKKSEEIDLTEFGKNGFSFFIKRYIYLENNSKGISVSLKNNNTIPYLINASVLYNDDKSDIPLLEEKGKKAKRTPFMILPPLYRLEPSSDYTWRVRRMSDGEGGQELAKDRETLFWIAFRGIPLEENKKGDSSSVKLTVTPTFYFKLLYRPHSLEQLNYKDVIKDVMVEKNNDSIVINNKSPLYMSFEYLKIGDSVIKNDNRSVTVKPFSTLSIKIPDNSKGELSWKFNDENFFVID